MSIFSKVVYWNIWGHRHAEGIHAFLTAHNDADVLCLTEVTHMSDKELAKLQTVLCYGKHAAEAASAVNGFQQLQQNFQEDFVLAYETATRAKWQCEQFATTFKGVGFGSALLMRQNLAVVAHGHKIIDLSEHDVRSRVLQWVVYEKGGFAYLVAHLHGVWIEGNTKGDHVARDKQSLIVREELEHLQEQYLVGKVVFGGDLNLDHNTRALALLAQGTDASGSTYRSLIHDHRINNTRTSSYRKYEHVDETRYADYVFVSESVDVQSFVVHNEVLASDHAPLIVQFS